MCFVWFEFLHLSSSHDTLENHHSTIRVYDSQKPFVDFIAVDLIITSDPLHSFLWSASRIFQVFPHNPSNIGQGYPRMSYWFSWNQIVTSPKKSYLRYVQPFFEVFHPNFLSVIYACFEDLFFWIASGRPSELKSGSLFKARNNIRTLQRILWYHLQLDSSYF